MKVLRSGAVPSPEPSCLHRRSPQKNRAPHLAFIASPRAHAILPNTISSLTQHPQESHAHARCLKCRNYPTPIPLVQTIKARVFSRANGPTAPACLALTLASTQSDPRDKSRCSSRRPGRLALFARSSLSGRLLVSKERCESAMTSRSGRGDASGCWDGAKA